MEKLRNKGRSLLLWYISISGLYVIAIAKSNPVAALFYSIALYLLYIGNNIAKWLVIVAYSLIGLIIIAVLTLGIKIGAFDFNVFSVFFFQSSLLQRYYSAVMLMLITSYIISFIYILTTSKSVKAFIEAQRRA